MEAEYKKLKKEIEKSFAKVWGGRCEIKDIKQFPELKKQKRDDERCMTCAAYDKLDAFLDDLKTSL